MRRFLLTVVVLTAAASAGAAGAHVIDLNPSLTISRVPARAVDPGARVLVFGRLRSADSACRSRKAVQLRLVRPGRDPILARDLTDAEGEYRFVLRPRRDVRVYARFAGSFASSYGHQHACHSDSSRALLINVR